MSEIKKLYIGTAGEVIGGELCEGAVMVWLERPLKMDYDGIVTFEDDYGNAGVLVECYREIRPNGGGYEVPISLKPVRGWQEIVIEDTTDFSLTALMDDKVIVTEWTACQRAKLDLPRRFWAPVRAALDKLCLPEEK